MATTRQRKAIVRMVDSSLKNGGKPNVSKAMIEAGYSKATAKTPSKLTDSKGYEELLDEYGLTKEMIVTALAEDIKLKPQNRKPELELASKIRGMLVDRTDITSAGNELEGLIVVRDNNANDKS